MFEAQGHSQIFTSTHLSLKKVLAIYPAVHSDGTHDSVNSLGRKSCRNLVPRTNSSLERASLVGNEVYNHKKTITKKHWSYDSLISRILFYSPQL